MGNESVLGVQRRAYHSVGDAVEPGIADGEVDDAQTEPDMEDRVFAYGLLGPEVAFHHLPDGGAGILLGAGQAEHTQGGDDCLLPRGWGLGVFEEQERSIGGVEGAVSKDGNLASVE